MPWVRLSDDWYDDPDLIEAGPLSMLVFPLLISWSLRNLQDGKVPSGQIRRLVDWSELGAEPEQAIAPLVACGRLQEQPGGYLIVNFLKYQPSREKVLGDREKDKQRKAAGRSAGPTSVQTESTRNPNPPDPVPVPNTSPSSSSTSDAVPDAVWLEGARKKAAKPGANVGDFGRWSPHVIAKDKAEQGDDIAWIWATYEITVDQLASIVAGADRRMLNNLRKRTEPAA